MDLETQEPGKLKFDFEKGEILLVNKPYKWTSFDVVNLVRNYIRKQLGLKKIKIGHAGTLDPLASGLLILCTGRMTKRIEEFKEFDKEYTGTFVLGSTTASFDLEKEIDFHYPWEHITKEEIQVAVEKLTGNYDQLPPVFSAKKIKGKRAYDYARKDQEVIMVPKNITISAFEVQELNLPQVHFRVACSKGTYIRALARDLGLALNTGAHLSALCRTRIGPYSLRDAYDVEDLKSALIEKSER
ncbi:MAG: tRNA pseudouridine(55) synthase TruB [Bacteroidetes bacterium]|nr:tRNA pseudouridine(55) synthase TruB [Bacteroidota bacterium]